MNSRLVLSFLLLITFYHSASALVVGSLNSVSVESLVTFPSADTDNAMVGFGWIKNGFTLEDMATTCSFDNVFPVSGLVALNGGLLRLYQDILFKNSTTLQSMGTILGNGHVMHLCPSINAFPSEDVLFDSLLLYCNADLDIVSTVTFRGNAVLCGTGNVLTLKNNAALVIDAASSLELRDLEIRGINGSNIRCIDDTGRLILDSVRWVQSDQFSWGKGNFLFKDQVSFMGSHTFSYESSQTSTIDICSELTISDGVHFFLGRDPDTLNNPLEFSDGTSCMRLDNCSLMATDSGLQLTKGTLFLSREVNLDAMSTTSQMGIILGDGTPSNDVTVWFAPGVGVFHNSGYWVYNNSSSDKLKSSSRTARLIRALGSKIYVPKSFEIKNLTVELVSPLVSAIEVESGNLLSYNNAAVRLPDIKFYITCDQLNAFTYSLGGNDSLFLTKGTLPIYLAVSGLGNVLRGNGGVTGGITLTDAGSHLLCGLNDLTQRIR